MSRFLKFIVHFIVICTIGCVLALALPPFFGVNTVIIDDSSKATNLPLGSVTYAIPQKAEEAYVGEKILVQDESKMYSYMISSLKTEEKPATVIDPSNAGGEQINVAIQDYIPKIVITIPYMAYLLVATESTEGLIVLGLAVLFLIILYIIAELWKSEPEEEEEIADPAPGYVKSKKELKREEKIKAKQLKEEERQIKNEEKKNRKKKKTVRTGGFVDEIEEAVEEEEEVSAADEKTIFVQNVANEAHEVLKKEIAAVSVSEPARKSVSELGELKKKESKAAEKPEAQKVGRMAIPMKSVQQLKAEAEAAGDQPEIMQDDITKVTLFDYSFIISGEE